MPTRRQFEMTVIVFVLLTPALAMINLWLKKHLVVTGNGITADAAKVGLEIL